MSLRAMVWVLHDAPTKNHAEFAVLMALADRAGGDHDEGAAAYPSHAWIAEKVQCSTSTVKRHLKELERRGLIRRGDQRIVEKFRHDRRPVVWDLDLSQRREAGVQNEPSKPTATGQDEPSLKSTGVHSEHHGGSTVNERGFNHDGTVGHSCDLQTVLNHPVTVHKPSDPPIVPQGGRDTGTGQEVEVSNQDQDAPGKRKRGSRLDPEFMPTRKTIDTVRSKFPGITPQFMEYEHDKFHNHFASVSGAKGTKLDWDATWRNWIYTSVDRLRPAERAAFLQQAPSPHPHQQQAPSKGDQYRDIGAQIAAEFAQGGGS